MIRSLDKFVGSRSQFFWGSLVAFICGVAVGFYQPIGHFFIFCATLSLSSGLIFFWRSKKTRVIIILALFFLSGVWRFQLSRPDFSAETKIYHYNGQMVEFSALIKNVDRRINSQKITLQAKSLSVASGQKDANGNVLATVGLYPRYYRGQTIQLKCRLLAPEKYEEFDYPRYLSRYQIYSLCYRPEITLLGQNQLSQGVYLALDRFYGRFNSSIPDPPASILSAMIFGLRQGIPDDISEDFSRTGISHIISISGMHIVIVLMIINFILIGCGFVRQRAFWLAVAAISVYIIFIGAPASAVRSAIMGVLLLLAAQIGRLNYSSNALVFAAFVMILFNPWLLIADIGFQLSFLASAGIIYFHPFFKNKFRKIGEKTFLGLADILSVTVSAQLMTLPLIIFYFGGFSPISLLANLLILPFIPLMMILGLVNSLVSLASLTLGRLFGVFSWLATEYMVLMSNWLSKIPGGYVTLGGMNFILMLAGYFLLVCFIFKIKRAQINVDKF
jgi:competence protein ComEC